MGIENFKQRLSQIYKVVKEDRIKASLDYQAVKKSKEWDRDVKFTLSTEAFDISYFIKLSDYFLQYGLFLIPFTYFESRRQIQKHCYGFYNSEFTPEILYINRLCFEARYENDLISSALNVSFHEYIHCLSINHNYWFACLLCSVYKDDYDNYVKDSETKQTLESIYGDKNPNIEYFIRYIANNPDTTPLLKAIYYDDKNFIPHEYHSLLYDTLKNIPKKHTPFSTNN